MTNCAIFSTLADALLRNSKIFLYEHDHNHVTGIK